MKFSFMKVIMFVIWVGIISLYGQPNIENEHGLLVYPQAQDYPLIDGEMDAIWLNAPRYVIANYAIGANQLENNPWYDCSGEWRAMWHDQVLLFYAEVRDDSLKALGDDYTEETDGYRWDSFEFYVDANHSRGTTYDAIDDVQFRVHYNDKARTIWVWTDLKGPAYDISEFEWEEKITEHGWSVEFMAIMDEIFLFPEPGMIIGTDVHYNDNDHQEGREHKIIAFGKVERSHADPSYFGEAILSGWLASDTLMVVKTNQKPEIDGELDDLWSSVPVISGNRYMDMQKLQNYADLSMTTRMMWDETYLYYFVKVWDDTLLRDGTGDHNDDGIEIYVDGDYSHGATYDKVNDFQFAFSYKDGTPVLDAVRLTGSSTGTEIDLSGVLQAASIFGDTSGNILGVTLEAAFPLSALQINPMAGHIFGIEMDYNDDDDGGDRDTKLKTYSKSDDTWQNPGLLTPAKLISTTAGEFVAVEETNHRRSDFSLSQNFPNPFNPSTDIIYSLNQQARVRITVYDILGHEVQTLVNDTKEPGQHSTHFNAQGLASGVYVYRLETAGQVLTKKMLLLK